MGYKKIYVFRDGIPGWIQAGYPTATTEALPKVDAPFVSAEKLKTMLDNGEDFVLLDARNIVDSKKMWIEHGKRVAIDLEDLPTRHQEIPRGKKIVIVDVNGKRSGLTSRYLHLKGYSDLLRLEGGMAEWVMKKMPTSFSN